MEIDALADKKKLLVELQKKSKTIRHEIYLLKNEIKRLKKGNVTPRMKQVMKALYKGADTLHEIHLMTKLAKSSIAFSLEKLVELGIVMKTGRYKKLNSYRGGGTKSPCYEITEWKLN